MQHCNVLRAVTVAACMQGYNIFHTTGKNTTASVVSTGAAELQLIADWDELLGTDINFLFGTWQADALAYAQSDEDVRVDDGCEVWGSCLTGMFDGSTGGAVGVQRPQSDHAVGYVMIFFSAFACEFQPLCCACVLRCSVRSHRSDQ